MPYKKQLMFKYYLIVVLPANMYINPQLTKLFLLLILIFVAIKRQHNNQIILTKKTYTASKVFGGAHSLYKSSEVGVLITTSPFGICLPFGMFAYL